MPRDPRAREPGSTSVASTVLVGPLASPCVHVGAERQYVAALVFQSKAVPGGHSPSEAKGGQGIEVVSRAQWQLRQIGFRGGRGGLSSGEGGNGPP